MYSVELYIGVPRACMVDGMSVREASRVFGLHRDTIRKMLKYAALPGCRRRKPPRRPKIGPYTGVIDEILSWDMSLPKKRRHTAKRIYERLRDERGFEGGYRQDRASLGHIGVRRAQLPNIYGTGTTVTDTRTTITEILAAKITIVDHDALGLSSDGIGVLP